MIKINKPNLEYNDIEISEEAKKLLNNMLNYYPNKRSWEDVYTVIQQMA